MVGFLLNSVQGAAESVCLPFPFPAGPRSLSDSARPVLCPEVAPWSGLAAVPMSGRT